MRHFFIVGAAKATKAIVQGKVKVLNRTESGRNS